MKQRLTIIFLGYLKFWSKIALFLYSGKIIGIAGSVGKTSTKQALKIALEPFGRVKITEGNSETGVPLGILGLKQEAYGLVDWLATAITCPFKIFNLIKVDYLLVEMGTDDLLWPKNMEYLLSVVKPEYVIWLNTSPAHLEQFGKFVDFKTTRDLLVKSRTALANEDGKILTKNNFKYAVLNNQDEFINEVIKNNQGLINKLSFFGDEVSGNYLLNYEINFPNTSFKIKIGAQEYNLNFSLQVLPKEYWENFVSVLLIIKKLNLDVNQAIGALEKNWKIPNGRGGLFSIINNSWLIDGSYNASPDAFTSGLELLDTIAKNNNLLPIVVAGDMRELGRTEESAHIELAGQIARVTRIVYCVGEMSKKYLVPNLNDAGVNVQLFENSYTLGEYLKNNIPQNSIIFVKGSQNTIFLEETIKLLLINQTDVSRLCRQSLYWLKTKADYFQVEIK